MLYYALHLPTSGGEGETSMIIHSALRAVSVRRPDELGALAAHLLITGDRAAITWQLLVITQVSPYDHTLGPR